MVINEVAALTKVDVVFASTFSVHLVDKKAGNWFEKQAEDGRCCAEAVHVSEAVRGIVDPKMDDVSQDCQKQTT